MSNSGSIEKLILNNVDYPVSGEADFSRTSGDYAVEGQPTSGDTNFKYAKQVQNVEGVDIVVNGANRANLIDLVNRKTNYGMAYTTANGDTYTATGHITITGDATQDAKVTCTMIPERKWTGIVV